MLHNQLVIDEISDEIIIALKKRAERHNRSLQQEVQSILESTLMSNRNDDKPTFLWVGALKSLKDRYTSITFQNETVDTMLSKK